jgi:hypothetical protein
MPEFKKTVGSKSEVWNKTAKKTSGGLMKKDLARVKKRGEYRIVSKKQQALGKLKTGPRAEWSKAVKEARKQLIKEKKIKKGEFIPILKKISKKYNKTQNKKGRDLYRLAKEIYSSKK